MTTKLTFLGTGEMGAALARAALGAGYPATVWNRTADKAAPLRDGGGVVAATARDAVAGAGLVVVCLFDHASVHAVLDPIAGQLAGRRLLNVTTTNPQASRELASWAAAHGIAYLDGGIMATPEMIGGPTASVLYSGSQAVFEENRALFETWGRAEYFGDDAGMAALYDLALLAGMYVMFAGFMHGAAMVRSAGVTAKEFAARAGQWLSTVTPAFTEYASIIDSGEYGAPGQQSLEFSDLTKIVEASRDQGINTELLDVVQGFIRRQIDAGHGSDGLPRMYESIATPRGDAA